MTEQNSQDQDYSDPTEPPPVVPGSGDAWKDLIKEREFQRTVRGRFYLFYVLLILVLFGASICFLHKTSKNVEQIQSKNFEAEKSRNSSYDKALDLASNCDYSKQNLFSPTPNKCLPPQSIENLSKLMIAAKHDDHWYDKIPYLLPSILLMAAGMALSTALMRHVFVRDDKLFTQDNNGNDHEDAEEGTYLVNKLTGIIDKIKSPLNYILDKLSRSK